MIGRQCDWNEAADGTHAKRQRSENSDLCNLDNDYFHEILEGSLPTPESVYNSWLRDTRFISDTTHAEDDRLEKTDMSDSLRSLSQQLLQVKRKLWPCAKRCAHHVNETGKGHSSPQKEFTTARRLCNPMESLGEGRARGLNQMFMNRSAIKLANIDAILDFGLTSCEVCSPFLFVDLCGAPGGFSEYLMMRREHLHVLQTHGQHPGHCMGYGMSLIGANEHGKGVHWKLDHISEWNHESTFFSQYSVCMGIDGTGDIYKWDNVECLMGRIRNDTQVIGISQETKAHLVVADGGFDAQRDSESQEELAQKLVISEMAAGIYLLGTGGKFVLKMFGFQTETVRTAMQSMFDMFEKIQVLKPISSRPASSERYVVFSGFKGLPKCWDFGHSWIGRVLLNKATLHPPSHYMSLMNYLDEIDTHMLQLNLKACFAIMSTLDRKSETIARDGLDSPELNYRQNDNGKLDINRYKVSWRLN